MVRFARVKEYPINSNVSIVPRPQRRLKDSEIFIWNTVWRTLQNDINITQISLIVSAVLLIAKINKMAVLSQGTTARCSYNLHRKLAPNPRVAQWIARTLKPSANIRKLSKKHFTSILVKDLCMSPHGITRPPDQSSRNSGNKFRLTTPNAAKFCSVPTKSVHSKQCTCSFAMKQKAVHIGL